MTMTVQTHYLTVGDTLVPLGMQLYRETDDGDEVVDVSNDTVLFAMTTKDGTEKVALSSSNVTKVNAAQGKVQYNWQAADVDTAGEYWAWMVRRNTSKDEHFPQGRMMKVVILPKEHD